MKINKIFITLILLIVVLITNTTTFYITKNYISKENNNNEEIEDLEMEYKSYVNEKLGFKIDIPQGFELSSEKYHYVDSIIYGFPGDLIVFQDSKRTAVTSFSIYHRKDNERGGTLLSEFAKTYRSDVTQVKRYYEPKKDVAIIADRFNSLSYMIFEIDDDYYEFRLKFLNDKSQEEKILLEIFNSFQKI